ncbi:thymidine phosphorylase [Streptomyces atratus]|uniref:Pyrimidine-nucleoside phosphorylase n=1 Tax=Streptomyces atratus TaxID=1893 RepID=A0A1K2C8T5_STRAR|nr:thymidine phosphorylase [Streptomyces atratus]SFY07313.1 pyrimidine-nucleoside phosphorylase [Streptomyces atratus]
MTDTFGVDDALEHIERLRHGETLTTERASAVLGLHRTGRLADYQLSSWLATIAARGLRFTETVALTRAYLGPARRGARIRRSGRTVVDKHSTGGIGDKTTLVVVPLVAALGVRVCKLSGRGLGIAGGTIDKLESVPGLRLEFTEAELAARLAADDVVIGSFSGELVPGDTATYDLRSVSGCVRSAPLIAASIVSKKVAVDADAVVFDVRYGAGSLVPDHGTARRLAGLLVRLGGEFGLRCRAVLSDGSVPLGRAVGNAAEVDEAVEFLRGSGDRGLAAECEALAVQMVRVAEPDEPEGRIRERLRSAVDSGAALSMFVRMLTAQGGDTGPVLDGGGYCRPGARTAVLARGAGWVTDVSALGIGRAALKLGAGKVFADDVIDPHAGIRLTRHLGERVAEGDVLAEVFHRDGLDSGEAVELVAGAVRVGPRENCRVPREPEPVSEADVHTDGTGVVHV